MAEKKVIIINVETNIDELTSKLNETNNKLNQLLFAEQNDVKATRDLVNQKKALQNQINELNNAVKSNSDQVRTSINNFGGLGNSINQISRELPAFTMNMNTGFLAISNNLPILFDEINKVKQANIELAATGQPTQSVFKALTSAIFSWGTALSIGVTLLTVYGGKIIEYFTKDNEQRNINEELIKKQNEAIKKQHEEVSKESSAFVTLIARLKSTNQNSKERNELIKNINEQYGTTLKNLSDEIDFQKQLNTEVDNYIKYKIAEYNLKTYDEKIQKLLDIRQEKQEKVNKAQKDYNEILKQYQQNYAGVTIMQVEYARNVLYEEKKALEENTNALKYLGIKSQETSIEIDNLTNSGTKYVKQLDKQKEKIEEIRDLNNEIVDEQIKQIDEVNKKEQTQAIVNAERRIKEVQDSNATETQKAQLIKLIKENLITDLEKLDEDYYAKDIAANKKANELKIQGENDYLLKIENLQEENYLNSLSKKDRDIQLINDKYFALEEAAKGNAEQEKIIAEAKANEINKIEKDAADKSNALQNEKTKKYLQLSLDALNILSEATTLFDSKNERQARRNFVITKALNLATAITNTALAVTSALATTKEIFPGQRFIEAGVVGAAGAVQIAKISQTQFNAGGGGAGGNLSPNAPSGASSGVNAPNLSFSMQGGGSSTAQLLNSVLGQPLKAYVVSSDITSAQMLDAKAIKTSVL